MGIVYGNKILVVGWSLSEVFKVLFLEYVEKISFVFNGMLLILIGKFSSSYLFKDLDIEL